MTVAEAPINAVRVSAFTVPTDMPESDGTLEWSATTMVLVEIEAAGEWGIGYTYAEKGAATLIDDKFSALLRDRDAFAIAARWRDLRVVVRNLGERGIAAMAISAVDAALWDLKARLLGIPLVTLLGQAREVVPVYGSGGFTSYDDAQLTRQFQGWRAQGIPRMKMKVGRDPERDMHRVRTARSAIGDAELFVDANGAYDRKQALDFAHRFHEEGVSWFEEPVSSDDIAGLRLMRDRAPRGMEISTGEYGYCVDDFLRLLEAGAVDVLQADATRCGGITGFLQAAALCHSFHIPLSSHTAPALHLHACAAALPVRHMEWFHDHVRIERMFFDGVPEPANGLLRPDLTRPGNGLTFRDADAHRYAVT